MARVVVESGKMSEVIQFDMPFVNDLPRRERTRWQRMWDAFQEAKRVSAEKGMLVPATLAAKIAGVSKQRIAELCDKGTLERVYLNDHVFIPEKSLLDWAEGERKAGRPVKTPSTKADAWKLAREFAAGK